jgi:Transposase DDE domain
VVRQWRSQHPDEAVPDGLVLTQPWPSTNAEKARGIPDRVIYYQLRHDRSRRTLRGIDDQVAKAERAVDGKAPVKRNRYIHLTGATKSVNRELEAKTRALAGWKGYTTNLTTATPEFVIDAYHQLWHIERSFRMSKHDLQARPIYHHIRESIEAHLSIVVAALAVSHWIERQTSWTIKKFVCTARRYRTVHIKAGRQILTAADPLPDGLRLVFKLAADEVFTELREIGHRGRESGWLSRMTFQRRMNNSGRRPRAGSLPGRSECASRRQDPTNSGMHVAERTSRGIVKLLARCGAARIGRYGDCGNVQGLSVPDRGHRARGVAVSPFRAEPARRRGTDAGPRCGGHPRDDPVLVCQVRAGLRQQAASAPTPPRRQMAPR